MPELSDSELFKQSFSNYEAMTVSNPETLEKDDYSGDYKNLVRVSRDLTAIEKISMKIGRNSPCGCGSGQKFKNCCRKRNWSKQS